MAKDVAVERIKPTLYLTEKDCPDIKKMKVGKGYDFIIHATMMPTTLDKESKPPRSGRFEIIAIESPNPNQQVSEDDFTDKKLKMLEEKSKE